MFKHQNNLDKNFVKVFWIQYTGYLKIVIIDLNSVICPPGITVVLQPEILNTG